MRLGIILLFLLAACAQPATNFPSGSRDEIAAERQYESSLTASERAALETKRLQERIRMETRIARVAARVAQAGADVCVEMSRGSTHNACAYSYKLDEPKSPLNAYADGTNIVVSPSMMRFLKTDEELAIILGHETAHNIMEHAHGRLQNAIIGGLLGALVDGLAAAKGANTNGDFSKMGTGIGSLSHSLGFESEADYVGLYIMARAHYDIRHAAELWRRFAVKVPASIYIATDHPTAPERFVAMEKTVHEIQAKQRRHLPLLPDLVPADK